MSAHRYWRVKNGSVVWRYSGYYFNIYEIRFYTGASQTGTEFALTSTGIASSSYGTGYEIANANDNNSNTRWASSNNAGEWWGVDCGAGNAYDLLSLSILPFADGNGCAIPVYLDVEYSDNNSTWASALPAGCTFKTTNTTTDKVWQYFNIPQLTSGGGIGNQISGGQIG